MGAGTILGGGGGGGEPILEGNREEVRPKREMGGGGTKE